MSAAEILALEKTIDRLRIERPIAARATGDFDGCDDEAALRKNTEASNIKAQLDDALARHFDLTRTPVVSGHSNVISLERRLTASQLLKPLAQAAQSTLTQARVHLLALVTFPESEVADLLAVTREDRMRELNRQTGRQEDVESFRRTARSEKV